MAVATTVTREELLTTRQARLLLAYLDGQAAFERARRRARLGAFIVVLSALCVFALSAASIEQGWATGDWENVDWLVGVAVPTVFLLGTVPGLLATVRPYRAASRELRRLLSGDALAALPMVPSQPLPFLPGELSPQPEILAPLRGLSDATQLANLRAGQMLRSLTGLLLLLLAVPAVGDAISTYFATPQPATLALLVVLGAVVVGVGLFILLVSIRASRQIALLARGLEVVADADGLRWREPGTRRPERTLPWSEVTGFLLVWLGHAPLIESEWAYLLVSDRATLLWTLPPIPAPADTYAADYLARLVATRTGLLLRDATEPVATVARALTVLYALSPRTQAQRFGWQGVPFPKDVASDRAVRRATRRRGWMWACLGIVALVALVFSFAPLVIQTSQANTYGAQLSQAEAATPIFSDVLTQTDGSWAPAPSNPSGSTTTFTANGYVLGGVSGQNVESFATQTFAGQALALSVVEQQQATNSNPGGAGLILRSSADGNTIVAFFVDGAGDWVLAREEVTAAHPNGVWTNLLAGNNAAIGQGPSANNTLTVLVRGTSDYCFVNGTLLGFITDDTAPTSGQVGLFVNDGAVPATFTNFAVYPVS